MNSTSEEFQSVTSHLAQRLFDPVPEVRKAVGQVAGQLLLKWQYRQVNQPYLVPMLLTK